MVFFLRYVRALAAVWKADEHNDYLGKMFLNSSLGEKKNQQKQKNQNPNQPTK